MPELHPLIWALMATGILVAIFEMVRLLPFSGTFSVFSAGSVTSLAAYVAELDLSQFIEPKHFALVMLVTSVFGKYSRWRTGRVTGDGEVRGTGDGRLLRGTGTGL